MTKLFRTTFLLSVLGVIAAHSSTAQATVFSTKRVQYVKVYDGGTVHINFKGKFTGFTGPCNADWAEVQYNDLGADRVLSVALAAHLSGKAVNVDVVELNGRCNIGYLQITESGAP